MLSQYNDVLSMRLGESVVSSRVRLARNVMGYPFPFRMHAEQKQQLLATLRALIQEEGFCRKAGHLDWIDLKEADKRKRSLLLEKHLISPHLFAMPDLSAVMTGLNERISVMVFEEDHLRIQGFSSGYDLEGAYVIARNVDQAFEKALPYAFDETKGYLTSCPTNLGTGLRASVMLFLPALMDNPRLPEEKKKLAADGYTLRGFYGEGTKSQGSIFQLSNQVTMGISEEDILDQLQVRATELVAVDWEIMEAWSQEERFKQEDLAFKSFGTAKHALGLTLEEAVRIARDLRLARRMRLPLPLAYEIRPFNQVVYAMQSAHISSPEPEQRQMRLKRRADLIREMLIKEEEK